MSKSVVVLGEVGKSPINVSESNSEFGYILVQQKRTWVDNTGWVRSRNVTAQIPGAVSDLEALGYESGMEIPGTIVVVDSLTPFNTREPQRDHKLAGKTGIVCCLDGQPIYRKNIYKQDPNALDQKIQHNNNEDIRAGIVKAKAEDESFSL